jgi:uncharacterized protein YjbI with pentapeptide repeats
MFDYDSKRGYKKIGFHSDNLRKLDLSELSFKNVFLGDAGVKNFADTNININLGECYILKSYIMKTNSLYVMNMSLKNVDLSDNHFNELYNQGITNVDFVNCDLSDTGLGIYNYEIEGYTNPIIEFSNCNLKNMDLSHLTIEGIHEASLIANKHISNEKIVFSADNNFYGTNVTFKIDSIEKLRFLKAKPEKENQPIDKYKGCYFLLPKGESRYIKTDEENKTGIKNINRVYKNFVNKKEKRILEIVRNSIDNRFNENYEVMKYDTTNDAFKLNKESKDKIRQRVSELLEHKPYNPNARIKLPKNLLEDLLFDYHIDVNDVMYKTIGFTSHNIDKLDFSEVDFEDVTLDYAKEFKEKKETIFLAGTNARIDFTKTYEYKTDQPVYIRYVDLGGVDLSNNDLKVFTNNKKIAFVKADLRDTNLKVTSKINANFIMCDLRYVNLRKIKIDLYDKKCITNEALLFSDCNLSNTQINFVTGENASKKLYKQAYELYSGCYINGKLILNSAEQLYQRKEIMEEYNKYYKNKISRTLSLVKKQINDVNKKEDK